MLRLGAILVLSLALFAIGPADAQEAESAGPDGGVASDGGVAADGGVAVDGGLPQVDLTTPRSTARSFVLSMQRATNDRPDLISDAVRCLDVAWLEAEENGDSRARQLAADLFNVLGKLDIVVEGIPNTVRKSRFVLWRSEDTDLAVTLVRSDESWRFSRETLEQLDEIHAAIKQKREESESSEDLQVQAALRSPRATMRTFLAAMDADPPDVERAASCLEPPQQRSAAWPVLQHDQAYRLYGVLLRVRAPLLSDIPDRAKGEQYIWFVHEGGRVVLARMQADNPDAGVWHGEWRFSRSTLSSLEDLYEAHENEPVLPQAQELGYTEHLSLGLWIERGVPAALRVEALGLALWKWFGVLLVLLLAILVFALAELGARVTYLWMARNWQVQSDVERFERLSRTVGWLVMLIGLYGLISANALLLPAGPLAFVYPAAHAAVLIAVALLGLRSVQIADDHAKRSAGSAPGRVTGLLLPLLESFFRLLIGAIVIAFMLRLLGFSQAAVLGSLGLLGAAVGLASQGSIANVVSAISIVYDRPFRVGDWVNLNGVDATVERLGLVSVRLRTFYNSLLVVPNSQIVSSPVDNYGERRYRRLRHYLRLRYDTPATKIDALCEGLRELVLLHPYTRKDYYHVYLNELTPSSADVLIYIFFDVPDWATELRERHRFLIDELALVEDLGIELAYPTQRLLVEEHDEANESAGTGVAALGGPEQEGRRRAKKLFAETYGDPPEPRPPVAMKRGPLTAGFDDDGGDEGDGD